MPSPETLPRPPRRFRRRLFVVILAAGLVPALTFLVASHELFESLGSLLSLERLDTTLDRVGEELDRRAADRTVREDLAEAQRNLATARLAQPRFFATLRTWSAVLLAAWAVLLVVAAWLLGRTLSTPIERLSDGMLRLARGDLAHRLPDDMAGRADELRFLVRQFNRMAEDLLDQRDRLAVTEKIAAWQDVARAMAHDLKNPLTAMKMALARLDRADAAPDARAESLGLLADEIDVLMRLTHSFSTFAKLPQPVMRAVDLPGLLAEVCALYRGQNGVAVDLASGAPVTLSADPDQLRRAFGNLVKNAVEASRPEDGPVRVDVALQEGRARVVVSDAGAGIPASLSGADLTRGLATTKAGGSGLGLPISHKIVHDHGGTLRLEPRRPPARGTQAIVDLPVAGPGAQVPA